MDGKIIQLFNICPPATNFPNRQGGRVYSVEGTSPTLIVSRQPKIMVIE